MIAIRKFFLSCLMVFAVPGFSAQDAHAQNILNMEDHDNKPYYFGLTFGLNFSQHRFKYNESFSLTDTFTTLQPKWSPGFNLGLLGTLRLNKHFALRFAPSLAFAEKKLTYNLPLTDSIVDRSIESIYIHLPLQLKFESDRIKNFRFFSLLGGKFDYDLSSNARSRRMDEFLKVKPVDLGFEIGFGFEFYYPNFIFSPEIKLSQGVLNQLYKDPNLPLSNAINKITSRMIVISIHLEG